MSEPRPPLSPEKHEHKARHEPATLHVQVREITLEVLQSLGLDATQPREWQADMYYLRRLRKGGEEVRSVVRHSFLTLAVSTALYLLWEALRSAMKQ
ncbi:MAG: hypothetical protein K2Q12_03165 [Rickettsiales bacterium]|nr:hypothetical protein [Rickettsiales bacterium]